MTAHLVYHAPPQRHDQARLLRNVDQRPSVDLAAHRMAPAHQRLEAVTGAIVERKDRLEDDARADVAGQRRPQVGRHLGAVDDLLAQAVVEHDDAVAALVLGAIHRRDVWRRAAAVPTVSCSASTATIPMLAASRCSTPSTPIGSLNAIAIPLTDRQRVRRLRIVVANEHGEFVAADARDQIAGRRHAGEPARRGDQEFIAGLGDHGDR